MTIRRPATPAPTAAARSQAGTSPALSEFPGCRPVRITRAEIADYEGRIEYWDGKTETAFKACEPTTIYHEGPGQRLAALASRMAAVRGARLARAAPDDLVDAALDCRDAADLIASLR